MLIQGARRARPKFFGEKVRDEKGNGKKGREKTESGQGAESSRSGRATAEAHRAGGIQSSDDRGCGAGGCGEEDQRSGDEVPVRDDWAVSGAGGRREERGEAGPGGYAAAEHGLADRAAECREQL